MSHCTAPLSLKLSSTCLSLCGVGLLLESNVGQLMFSIADLRGDRGAHTMLTFIFMPFRGLLNAGWLTLKKVEFLSVTKGTKGLVSPFSKKAEQCWKQKAQN